MVFSGRSSPSPSLVLDSLSLESAIASQIMNCLWLCLHGVFTKSRCLFQLQDAVTFHRRQRLGRKRIHFHLTESFFFLTKLQDVEKPAFVNPLPGFRL
jgi:hypothetical protein